MAVIGRPGVWKRVGMTGVLAGLDLNEALASLASGLDVDFARRLFVTAEAAYLPAALALVKNRAD